MNRKDPRRHSCCRRQRSRNPLLPFLPDRSSFSFPFPFPSSPLFTLQLLSLLLVASIVDRDRSSTSAMAWTTMHRSCTRGLVASRRTASALAWNTKRARTATGATTRPGLVGSAWDLFPERAWGTRTAASAPSKERGASPGARIQSRRRLSSIVSAESSSSSSASLSRRYGYRDFLERTTKKGTVVLSYLTDIEGDKFYLDRYVDNSKVLTWIPNDDTAANVTSPFSLSYYSSPGCPPERFPYDRRIDFVDSNSMLVFGGDLWDKGGFDLYVTRQLLDLKRRYPDRVVWVLGNRDINKLRMMQELGLPGGDATKNGDGDGDVVVPYHPGLTWFRGSGRVGDPDGPLPSMDPGERLRWILGNTMGSPDAMEHRRQELAWEAGGCREDQCRSTDASTEESASSSSEISDCDVVRSYQESCHPRGEMGRFLSEALLAAKIGPVLFVHGSLPLTKDTMARARGRDEGSIWDDLTFCMPWINKTYHEYGEDHVFDTASDLGVESIEDWLEAVNGFAFQNIEAWEKDIARLESRTPSGQDPHDEGFREGAKDAIWAYRAGYGNGPSYGGVYYSDLIQYGMGMIPGGKKNPTVVYNSFTPEGMPTFFLPPEDADTDAVTSSEDSDGTSNSNNNNNNNNNSASESDVALCTREFFERSSMRLILTGHKPQGDMPSPIRVDNSSWVICADTSYSGDTKWFHDEHNSTNIEDVERRKRKEDEQREKRKRSNLGRGNSISFRGDTAVSEVLVELSGETQSLASVRYHGVLSDGTEYESVNLLDAGNYGEATNATSNDSDNNNDNHDSDIDPLAGDSDSMCRIPAAAAFLGRVAPTHMVPDPSRSPHEGRWWTKGICRDGSHLYYAGEGYNVWNYIVSPSDLDASDITDNETDDAAAESDVR